MSDHDGEPNRDDEPNRAEYDQPVAGEEPPDSAGEDEVGRPGEGAAIDATLLEYLSECVSRIQASINAVEAALDRRDAPETPRKVRPVTVIMGTGRSAFAAPEQGVAPAQGVESAPPAQALIPDEREPVPTGAGAATASDLFIAAELALAGRSRDEIRTHLREHRGPGAELTIADAFE